MIFLFLRLKWLVFKTFILWMAFVIKHEKAPSVLYLSPDMSKLVTLALGKQLIRNSDLNSLFEVGILVEDKGIKFARYE